MPKRAISIATPGTGDGGLSTWPAIGLPLAVVAAAVDNGIGTVAAAVVLTAVTWSLARLHSHTPSARSTCDLVGAVLGDRTATLTALLQIAAYALLAAEAARTTGQAVRVQWAQYPAQTTDWIWPLCSVALVVLAAAAVYALSTRVLAALCAVVAAAAVLVMFYLALAIIATVLSGTQPMTLGDLPPSTGFDQVATVLFLGMSLVGLEALSVASRGVRSIVRPMSLAIAVGVACAALVWIADELATTGEFRYDSSGFADATYEYLGAAGINWLFAALICAGVAMLLAMMWAAVRVGTRAADRLTRDAGMPSDVGATCALTTVVAALVVAMCRDWAAMSTTSLAVGATLLLTLYVLVAEASSRLPRLENFTWAIKVAMAGVLAAAVLVPLAYDDFSATALWRVALAVVLVAVAAGIAVRWPRLVGPSVTAESALPSAR
jgi:hypothetical protein